MNEQATERLRELVEKAIASGAFESHSDVATRAGLGPTALYRLMKNIGGVNATTQKAITKTLAPYAEMVDGKSKHTNGASNNGHAKSIEGPNPRLNLAEQVVTKLMEVRSKSKDAALRARIDEFTGRIIVFGLDILANAALGQE